jgi:cobalt-zinc-cadmium efflux system outer membrane protein
MRYSWKCRKWAIPAAGAILVLSLGLKGLAQESGLSLEKAIELALAGNAEVLLARTEVRSAAGRTLKAGALADPVVSLRDEGIAFRSSGAVSECTLGVEQGLEFPGKRSLRRAIGALGEEQAGFELERVRKIVAAGVKKAYYKAVLARRAAEALRASGELLDQFIASLEIRYRTGTASASDILRARVEKARLRNQILEEERNEAAAKAELGLMIGRAAGESATLTTDLAYAPFTKTLAEVAAEARATSASLKALSVREKQSENQIKLSKLSSLPDFELGLYYPSKRGGAWGFMFGLSVPIWKSKRQGDVMEAEAAREIAALSSTREEERLAARIRSAYASVKASENQVLVFEQALLKDMQDDLTVSLRLFEYGKVEFFNLLDLFRTSATARLEYVKSIYLYVVSLADLEVAGEEWPE